MESVPIAWASGLREMSFAFFQIVYGENGPDRADRDVIVYWLASVGPQKYVCACVYLLQISVYRAYEDTLVDRDPMFEDSRLSDFGT